MDNNTDWVEDVKRWCRSGAATAVVPKTAVLDDEALTLGYEAADPVLQARHWPDVSAHDRREPR